MIKYAVSPVYDDNFHSEYGQLGLIYGQTSVFTDKEIATPLVQQLLDVGAIVVVPFKEEKKPITKKGKMTNDNSEEN